MRHGGDLLPRGVKVATSTQSFIYHCTCMFSPFVALHSSVDIHAHHCSAFTCTETYAFLYSED
jgi:hypothetical protein